MAVLNFIRGLQKGALIISIKRLTDHAELEICLTQCVTFYFEVLGIKNTNDINMGFMRSKKYELGCDCFDQTRKDHAELGSVCHILVLK